MVAPRRSPSDKGLIPNPKRRSCRATEFEQQLARALHIGTQHLEVLPRECVWHVTGASRAKRRKNAFAPAKKASALTSCRLLAMQSAEIVS